MPVFGLNTVVPNANRILANSFLPAAQELMWPEICGSFVATRLVEPVPFNGAMPAIRKYQYGVGESTLGTYRLDSPQNLFSAWLNIAQYDLEYDQTGSLISGTLQGFGGRIAQFPDFALASRILNGYTTTSITGEDGKAYNCTIDTVPFFSGAHVWNGTTQSNILTGVQPATAAAWAALDTGTRVQQIIANHEALLARITSLVDDQGVLMYPGFDAQKSLVYWVPPIMRRSADVALLQPGSIVGGINGGSTGSTSVPDGRAVKKVSSPAFLAGCLDPFASTGAVSPVHATDYYAFIVDRPSRPFYYQTYRPPTNADYIPKGYDPAAQAKQILATLNADGVERVSPMNAEAYANAVINHNLGRIGANSDRDTASRRQFFMQPVVRGQVMYGFWPTAFKIAPTGYST